MIHHKLCPVCGYDSEYTHSCEVMLQRKRDFIQSRLNDSADVKQIARDREDAAIGRAYLRWYAAAKGYRNVIADAAHEAIMKDSQS